ncbi:MAG: DNA glycosylase AlkZ-like family protein [Jiangellaceae bacterium]
MLKAIRHLVALIAQYPNPPYLALRARLAGVERHTLTALLDQRYVVRSALLRGTQHMVAAADYRWLRPLLQPVLQRAWRGAFARCLRDVDTAELAAAARHELRDGRLLTRPELRDRLAARFPARR